VTTEAIAQAITADEIVPWYQPIVDLSTGAVVGVEALARWVRPGHAVEPTAAFIDVAERSDLIIEVDRAVMQQAFADLAAWSTAWPHLRLSLNLSGRQLDRDDWLDALQEAAATAGVAPARISLELTETLRPARLDKGIDLLRSARAAGFEVWLDDFGTGWASLYDLVHLPASGLKVDKCFSDDLGQPAVDAIVRAMAGAADELGLHLIIEGIATPEQARHARALGCHYAQGFLWSPAVPATDLPALLN
jgi:EAL domain-containing protein (putative c-di-GMP-specific phosphodiesterase class I)